MTLVADQKSPAFYIYMYIVCMCRARVFNSLSSCEMCKNRMENITTKSRIQFKRGRPRNLLN